MPQGHALLGAGGNEAACRLLGTAFDLLSGLAVEEAHPGFVEMSRAASLLSHRVRPSPTLILPMLHILQSGRYTHA